MTIPRRAVFIHSSSSITLDSRSSSGLLNKQGRVAGVNYASACTLTVPRQVGRTILRGEVSSILRCMSRELSLRLRPGKDTLPGKEINHLGSQVRVQRIFERILRCERPQRRSKVCSVHISSETNYTTRFGDLSRSAVSICASTSVRNARGALVIIGESTRIGLRNTNLRRI